MLQEMEQRWCVADSLVNCVSLSWDDVNRSVDWHWSINWNVNWVGLRNYKERKEKLMENWLFKFSNFKWFLNYLARDMVLQRFSQLDRVVEL